MPLPEIAGIPIGRKLFALSLSGVALVQERPTRFRILSAGLASGFTAQVEVRRRLASADFLRRGRGPRIATVFAERRALEYS